jgi:hypothetical protein
VIQLIADSFSGACSLARLDALPSWLQAYRMRAARLNEPFRLEEEKGQDRRPPQSSVKNRALT